MTNAPNFSVLVGLPGVGKSTYISKHANRENIVVASTDDIIDGMCADAGITYDQGFLLFIDEATKRYNTLIGDALKGRYSIVIDRTNLTVNSRRKLLARVPNEYKKYALYFPIPTDWNDRLKSRPGKCIPQNVIDNMIGSFQMPTKEEGFDAVFTIM